MNTLDVFLNHWMIIGVMLSVLAAVVFYSLYRLDVIHLDGRKVSFKGGLTTTVSTVIVFACVVALAATIINPLVNALSNTQSAGDFLFFLSMAGIGACIPAAIQKVDIGLKKVLNQ